MPFEAWALPWAFRVGRGETSVLADDGFPPLEHLVLPQERLKVLLGVLRAGREHLFSLSVSAVLLAVDRVAHRLLDPGDELRRAAMEGVAAHGGFSGPMAREILDGMARGWTRPPLVALLHGEFRNPGVLDCFQPSSSGGEVRAAGYPLSFHLGAGTVPGVATTSMIRSLLVKSAVLLKPGRGDVSLPVLFARALQEGDPELGQAVAVAYWPRAQGLETELALAGADQVVLYGGDETVAWVRARTPATTHLVEYRHRLGVGVVGREALDGPGAPPDAASTAGTRVSAREAALLAAKAVAIFDQRGCVSPHVFFVEEGGATSPEEWAEMLSGALEGLEGELPSGPLPPEVGAALQQFRGRAELEESLGRGRVFHGGPRAPWTVVYEPGGGLEPTCMNRAVRVVPVAELPEVLPALEPLGLRLQTVGVLGLGLHRRETLAGLLGLGVSRVVTMDRVSWPPAWWHHDGMGPLQSLVRWTDVEGV